MLPTSFQALRQLVLKFKTSLHQFLLSTATANATYVWTMQNQQIQAIPFQSQLLTLPMNITSPYSKKETTLSKTQVLKIATIGLSCLNRLCIVIAIVGKRRVVVLIRDSHLYSRRRVGSWLIRLRGKRKRLQLYIKKSLIQVMKRLFH